VRPTWLVDGLAGVMLVTAAYCLGRLVVARRFDRGTHVDVDVAHVAMGVAMAGMLVRSLRSLSPGVWEIVFAALAVWFVAQIVHFVARWGVRGLDEDHLHHASHYVTHLAMGLAMIYMFVALPSTMGLTGNGAMSDMGPVSGGASASGLPFVAAFVLLVAAVWYADGLTRFTRGRTAALPGPSGTAGSEVSSGRSASVVVALSAETVAVPSLTFAPSDVGGGSPLLGSSPAGSLASRVVAQHGAARRLLRFQGATVLCAHDRRWLAPRLEIATHITMCFAMGYMLVVMR
jgi:hypothetical protein